MTPREARDRAEALIAELIAAREALGMDRQEIARRSGMQRHVISTGELGDTVPRLTTLIRWADVLGYDVRLVKRE